MSKWYVADRLESLYFHNRLKGKLMIYYARVSDIRGGKHKGAWDDIVHEAQLTITPEGLSLVDGIEPGDTIEIRVIKQGEN